MPRQTSVTPQAGHPLHLAPESKATRAERVERLRVLVAAGLYRVDTSSLARAIASKRADLAPLGRASHSLDSVLAAAHPC